MAKSDGVVRRLVAQLSLEVDDKSVSAADRMLDGITGKLKAFAAIATVVKAADWVGGIIGEADRLNDAADRIGTTTEALQGLGFAADISGSSADSMMQGMKFLTKTIGEASGGSKEAVKAFHNLGVSFKNADGSLKNGADLFPEIADALAKIEDPTKRAALSMGVFSRAGQELQPFLAKGAQNIRDLQDEFVALGGVFEKTFVEDSALAQDNADKLAVSWKSVGAAIGKAVLPAMNRFTGKLLEWWKVHGPRVREVLESLFTAVSEIIELGVQLLAPWINLALLIADGWAQLLGLIRSVEGLMPILKVLGALALLFFAPWIALIAVIALIAEDIYQFATGGESVLGLLVDAAKELFKSLVKGVSDSVDEMLGFFTHLGDELGVTFDSFVEGVLSAVDEAIQTFMGLGQTVKDIFTGIVTSITSAFNELLALPSSIGAGIRGTFKGIAETFGINVSGDVSPSAGAASGVLPSTAAVNAGASLSNSSSNSVVVNVTANGDDKNLGATIADHVSRALEADRVSTYNALIGAAQ